MNSYAKELHGSLCDPVLANFAFRSVLKIPTFLSVYRGDPGIVTSRVNFLDMH